MLVPFAKVVKGRYDSGRTAFLQSKFVSWEPQRHPQKQYEKIGDHSRHCASIIQSLSTENLHFSTQLQATCREMCSESAKALIQLSLSMKHNTAPAPLTHIHVNAAVDLASHLENTPEAKDLTFRLVESVNIIKELVSSIDELSNLVPFKPFEQDSNVPELLTGRLGSSHRFLSAIQQEVATRTNQLVVLMKKFKIKCSSVSAEPDTTQPPVNLIPTSSTEPQKEED